MIARTATLIALVVSVGIESASAEDPLDRRIKGIDPRGADCGRIGAGGAPRSAVVSCVVEHFKSNRPFHARVDTAGEDSKGGTALVLEEVAGGKGGPFFLVEFDDIACGGANAKDPYCGTIIRQCGRPRLVPHGDQLRVVCNNEYQF
jgi:hypothetical protein